MKYIYKDKPEHNHENQKIYPVYSLNEEKTVFTIDWKVEDIVDGVDGDDYSKEEQLT